MNPADPEGEGKDVGKPPTPIAEQPYQPPESRNLHVAKERQSVGMVILKIIGYFILTIVILIGLALGTCLLLVATHK